MMRRKLSKKGGLELSLNLIIMLIIGLVVLGLVIGFVRNLVTKSTDSFNTQLDDQDKDRLNEVQQSPDNLAVSPFPKVDLKKGGEAKLFLKLRNYGDGTIDIAPGDLFESGGAVLELKLHDEDGEEVEGGIKLLGPGFAIQEGKEEARAYTLRAGTELVSGRLYFLSFTLSPPDADAPTTSRLTVSVK